MRSILLINGNNPKALLNSTLYGADALAYDLYSEIPTENKDEARLLVQEALQALDFGSTEVFVRINPLDAGCEEDLSVVCKVKPKAVILPLADERSVPRVSEIMSAIEKQNGIAEGSIGLIPQIETIQAVENVREVLVESKRVMAAIFGAKNLLNEMGVKEVDKMQLAYARSRVVLACLYLKLPAIDRAWLDVKDRAGFESDARAAHDLGYTCKLAANGSQVPFINEIFS